MTNTQETTRILAQLERLAGTTSLSDVAKTSGTRLLERLKLPVRTVILGLPDSGKSQIVNLLLGQSIIPADLSLPTLSVSWGKEPATTLTFEDETIQKIDGIALEQASQQNVIAAAVEIDLPILKKTSLLEVVADGTEGNQMAATDWAIEQADIVLWCSQGFSQQEQDLWSRVADSVKDHSFFVLTKADILASQGTLSQQIAALQDLVAEEFHTLIPVATLQGLSATGPDGKVDLEILKASGGKVLLTAILRQAASGRQADLDSASLFLKRYASHIPPETQATNQISQEPKTPHRAQSAPDKIEESAPESDVITSALVYLQDRSSSLVQSVTGPENSSKILDNCAEITNYLVNYFEEHGAQDERLSDAQETFMEAADILLLMQLEGDEDAAADAITLLLQLRRDLETQIAA